MVDEGGQYWEVGPLLRLGALNPNASLPPTSNYAGIQHQKFESSHGTTEGKGLCVRFSSILDKSPLENGDPIISMGDPLFYRGVGGTQPYF